jgi:hypothetical protein
VLTRTREGSSPFTMTSNQTSPVNICAGPLTDGCFGRISNVVSLLVGWCGPDDQREDDERDPENQEPRQR